MGRRLAMFALLSGLVVSGLVVSGCGLQAPALVEYKVPGTGASDANTRTAREAAMPPGAQPVTPLPNPNEARVTTTALPSPENQGRSATTALSPVVPKRVVVQRGDTVYAIARRYNLPVRGVIDANRLSPPYRLSVGQTLTLPRERVHVVRKGDTIFGIARRYGTDVGAVTGANGLAPPYRLTVGQRLRVPPSAVNQLIAEMTAPSTAANAATAKTQLAAVTRASPTVVPDPPPRTRSQFLWPVVGKVTSGFGAKGNGLHNDGVNIAARRGAAVRAAEDGVVVYTGNELRGYGNLVLVRHADGWTTAYAHNEKLLVTRGDTVRRGQIIARVGATGSVSTPQSHFELRRGASAVDPLKHLAKN